MATEQVFDWIKNGLQLSRVSVIFNQVCADCQQLWGWFCQWLPFRWNSKLVRSICRLSLVFKKVSNCHFINFPLETTKNRKSKTFTRLKKRLGLWKSNSTASRSTTLWTKNEVLLCVCSIKWNLLCRKCKGPHLIRLKKWLLQDLNKP